MANDLVVQLGAKLDQFASDMNTAGDMADTAVGRIEASFNSLNPGLGGFSSFGTTLTGITAAAAALLAVVAGMNKQFAEIAKNAEFTGQSLERFQQIKFVGLSGGVSSDQADKDLQNVAKLLADAKENENSLTKLLDANNIKYKDRNGQVISLNQLLSAASGLIGRFESLPEKTEAAKMLGLSEGWVEALKGGPTAFEAVAASAKSAGAVIDDETIKRAVEFDREWEKSSIQWGINLRAAAAGILPVIDDLIKRAGEIFSRKNLQEHADEQLDKLRKAGVPDEGGIKVEITSETQQALQEFQKAPMFSLDFWRAAGQIFSSSVKVLGPGEIPFPAADAVGGNYGSAKGPNSIEDVLRAWDAKQDAEQDSGDGKARLPRRKKDTDGLRDPFEAATDLANKRIAVINAETATIGQNTEARDRAKVVATLEEAAKRANTAAGKENTDVTEEQRVKINQTADAMLAASKAAREQQTAFQGLNDAVRFGGNELVNVLDQASQKGANFEQIMSSVLRNVTKQILQAAITGEGAFAKLFGFSSANGGVGGLGGLITSLFGGGTGAVNANGSIAGAVGATSIGGAPLIGANANGTDNWGGGPTWVGEDGPEVMNVPKGAQIIPNDILRRGGGGDITVNLIEDSSRAGQTHRSNNGNGGGDIYLYVDAITAKNAGNPGSATSQVLDGRRRLASR